MASPVDSMWCVEQLIDSVSEFRMYVSFCETVLYVNSIQIVWIALWISNQIL